MAQNFHWVDIDKFDENRFLGKQEEAAVARPCPDPGEADGLLQQGGVLRAFRSALQNCPINTKNQAVKVKGALLQLCRVVLGPGLWLSVSPAERDFHGASDSIYLVLASVSIY